MMNSTHQLMTSVEETEHKAVAYDLYEYLYGKGLSAYIPRVSLFTFSLILITAISTAYHLILMKRDKQLFNFKPWRKFGRFAQTEYKIFMPKFLDYYRFNFHPNDTDESDLVKQTKIKIGLAQSDSSLLH